MFDWFTKSKDDEEESKKRYGRRDFLRGRFLTDALDEAGAEQQKERRGEQEPEKSASDEPDDERGPVDLLAIPGQLDPHASERKFAPGLDDFEPRRRGTIPALRPPGAVAEEDFLKLCTLCGACEEACPHDAIVGAPTRFREAAGTPMIDALDSPCRMCTDMPCITACETGALRKETPKKIGLASLQRHSCLAYNNTFCTICAERCPVEGAIELDAGKPRIVAERCTGCGICHSVCPAPANAILIMPNPSRPRLIDLEGTSRAGRST